ncbi:hypothetical protein FB451DRAFT_1180557 [Mycena latifolia]|nr:hypothetical protein FB451DRAFT_1180557 [Mycena latifolia]
MHGLLEDNMDELERRSDFDELDAAHLAALKSANAELVARAEEQAKQQRLESENLQQQLRRAEAREHSESRAIILEEREEREAVEDDLNAGRHKLATALIELQQKEDKLEMKNAEIDDLVAEHERVVAVVLTERESESKDLRLNISELEANTDDLHSKCEAALAHLEEETEAKDTEIESMQQTIDKLGEQIFILEDETDRMKEDSDRLREEDAAELDRLEVPSAALKDKISALKTKLEEMTQLYEACSGEIQAHHDRQEELASHVEDLVAQRHAERAAAAQAAVAKGHAGALRAEHLILNTKESTLQRVLADLACTQALLATHDPDLTAVQAVFQAPEGKSHRAGETHSRPPQARFGVRPGGASAHARGAGGVEQPQICVAPQPRPSFSQSPFRSHPQFDLVQKRNRRLNEVVEAMKLP